MEITAQVLGDKEEFGHEHASQAAPQVLGQKIVPGTLFTSSDVALIVSEHHTGEGSQKEREILQQLKNLISYMFTAINISLLFILFYLYLHIFILHCLL